MEDTTQTIRAHRRAEINAAAADREVLSATYGQVWDTAELTAEFEVIGFLARSLLCSASVTDNEAAWSFSTTRGSTSTSCPISPNGPRRRAT